MSTSIVGQKGHYLYKQSGESFTLDATVIAVKGAQITIRFINPNGNFQHDRVLRTPAERARFSTDPAFEVKRRGGQAGNQNAAKHKKPRKLVTLSLQDERLEAITLYLKQHGLEMSTKHLRELAYAGIDALCKTAAKYA